MYIKRFNKFSESKGDKFPDIKEVNYSGFNIKYGRNAQSNDYLTFNIAEDDDIWMHVKGVPGSHVVIKIRDNFPDDDVLKHAAELAKKNSKGKNLDSVEVVYCKRKFVKKQNSMNAGQVAVDYNNSYTIKL